MILFNVTDGLERTEEEFAKSYRDEKESLEKAKQEPGNVNVNIAIPIEFDPDTIVDSIGDETDIFWQKVFKNHFLLGLLLGYGEKKAYLFDWVRRNSLPLESIAIHRFPEISRLKFHTKEVFKKNVTIADLVIPYFASFEIDDQELVRYAKEKKKIVSFFSDKELAPFVLKCFQINS